PDQVPVVPVVESPAPIPDQVPVVPVVESPAPIPDQVPPPEVAQPEEWQNIYSTPTPARPATAIPEPGTVVALLVTGAGIICSGRKRKKQVRQQR
ncbi:MAG: PEP-CTERM sorting domain-containing protein, partial [Microcoleus sp. T1-bin1]|nr:PEP-CTERM sorting domain-containing protein [Microcoleus sp. T1-bin1]